MALSSAISSHSGFWGEGGGRTGFEVVVELRAGMFWLGGDGGFVGWGDNRRTLFGPCCVFLVGIGLGGE